MSVFYTIFDGVAREGPGAPEDVAWAQEGLALSAAARICDAGCGSGADTETWARLMPEARIDAVEVAPTLARAARERLTPFGDRVRVREGDMADLNGPYDLIWCAGALYFLGITDGLRGWRNALAPGGRVVFSEPCLVADTEAARRFWRDYPALSDSEGITARVRAAGYRVLDRRPVVGAPWAAFYDSLEQRLDRLDPGDDNDLAEAISRHRDEIAAWRAAPDEIAYLLLITEPA